MGGRLLQDTEAGAPASWASPPLGSTRQLEGGAYLRSVKWTVSSLWEATITLALVLCFSSSRI